MQVETYLFFEGRCGLRGAGALCLLPYGPKLPACQPLFTCPPPMQTQFGTAGLDGAAWLRIALVSSSVFVLVELEKFIFHRAQRKG